MHCAAFTYTRNYNSVTRNYFHEFLTIFIGLYWFLMSAEPFSLYFAFFDFFEFSSIIPHHIRLCACACAYCSTNPCVHIPYMYLCMVHIISLVVYVTTRLIDRTKYYGCANNFFFSRWLTLGWSSVCNFRWTKSIITVSLSPLRFFSLPNIFVFVLVTYGTTE